MSIGAYEPFWIDNQERRLCAALHCSPAGRYGKTGALLVPPLLHEQHRSHRFLCELASCLSELGIPCLRFAFFGTGDSEGNGDQTDFASMASDIEHAAQALQERSGCETCVVIAFRSGALPLHAWLGDGGSPRIAVLWDPVLDGHAWLREMEAADALKRRSIAEKEGSLTAEQINDGQLMGYAVSETLRKQLACAGLADAAWLQRVPLWAVVRSGQDAQALPSRTFALPSDAPAFGTSVLMDATMMMSSRRERVVQQLGDALLAGN